MAKNREDKPTGAGTREALRARRAAAKREMLAGCSMNEAAKRVRKRFGLGVCFATLKEIETEIAREKPQRRGKKSKSNFDWYAARIHKDMAKMGIQRLMVDASGYWEITRTEDGHLA